jgi:hypothetical protein
MLITTTTTTTATTTTVVKVSSYRLPISFPVRCRYFTVRLIVIIITVMLTIIYIDGVVLPVLSN